MLQIHELHVYSLTARQRVASMHVVLFAGVDFRRVSDRLKMIMHRCAWRLYFVWLGTVCILFRFDDGYSTIEVFFMLETCLVPLRMLFVEYLSSLVSLVIISTSQLQRALDHNSARVCAASGRQR